MIGKDTDGKETTDHRPTGTKEIRDRSRGQKDRKEMWGGEVVMSYFSTGSKDELILMIVVIACYSATATTTLTHRRRIAMGRYARRTGACTTPCKRNIPFYIVIYYIKGYISLAPSSTGP
jgi:hypothetical protein